MKDFKKIAWDYLLVNESKQDLLEVAIGVNNMDMSMLDTWLNICTPEQFRELISSLLGDRAYS